jgi:hypothetical protein
LLLDPVAIAARRYVLHPVGIVEIPSDRLANAAFERFGRPPAKFSLDLAGIDRVASVVARPIGYEGDLVAIRFPSTRG